LASKFKAYYEEIFSSALIKTFLFQCNVDSTFFSLIHLFRTEVEDKREEKKVAKSRRLRRLRGNNERFCE
jgi:hypothetical protein